jgi:hypothetical protein
MRTKRRFTTKRMRMRGKKSQSDQPELETLSPAARNAIRTMMTTATDDHQYVRDVLIDILSSNPRVDSPPEQLLRLYDNAVLRQYQHNDPQPERFRLPELPDPPPDQAILETQQPPHSLLYWLLMGAFLAIVVGTFSLPI